MAKTGKIYYVDVEFTDAQVAAQFTFPCMFFLRNAAGQIIKHITYDLNGEKSVVNYSVPQDRILTLGTITATTTTLALDLHTSGVNSVLMSGVVRSKTEGDDFTFAPVSAGKLKYLLLYALPDPQLFHIIEGVEGNEAIYPDLPPGSLLIKAVLISEFGALLEDADGGYKPLAEDPWRNIVINSNAAVNIIVASSPSASFNVLVGAGVTAPKIAAIKTKVKKNTRDGQEITFYNDSDTPVALLPGDYEETLVYTTFPFADNYEIKPRSFAKFKRKENKYHELAGGGSASFPETGSNGDVLEKDSAADGGVKWSNRLTNAENEIDTEIVNRALADNALQSQITTEKNRNDTQDGLIANKQDKSMFSALVDKWIHYYDATTQKMQPILKFVSGVVNQLEFTGRIKADAIVLPNNTNPVVANRLRSDGNRLKYSDTFPIERDIAYLSDITGSRLIKQYVHTGNREIYPSAVDYTTSRITATGHGFSHGGVKLVGLFLNGMAANYNGATSYTTDYQDKVLVNTIPFEWLTAETWIKVIDANTLEVCNASGVAIAVNPTSTQNNGRLNFTKWHIEEFVPFSFSDIPPDYKNVEIRISGMCINRNYHATGNRYIGIWSYMSDYTLMSSGYLSGHSIFYIVLPKIAANNNINSVFFTLSVSLRTSNHRFTHLEGSEAQQYWSGFLQQNTGQQLIRLSSGGENKGIAGLKSITAPFANDSTWLSNYSIIEIYAI